jgi:hypothetical protein
MRAKRFTYGRQCSKCFQRERLASCHAIPEGLHFVDLSDGFDEPCNCELVSRARRVALNTRFTLSKPRSGHVRHDRVQASKASLFGRMSGSGITHHFNEPPQGRWRGVLEQTLAIKSCGTADYGSSQGVSGRKELA